MRDAWLVALGLGFCIQAQALERNVVPSGSEIRFQFTQMGVTSQGRFTQFGGTVTLDPAKPSASRMQMSVKTASFQVAREVDVEAVKPEWFFVERFPEATFVSESVTSLGAGRYEAKGPFTLKGVSRPLTVAWTLKERADGGAEMTGQFVVRRADHRIGEGEWQAFDTIANDVTVSFTLQLAAGAATK